MRKLYYILNINYLKTIYFAYYHSLKYGIIYWGSVSGSSKVFFPTKENNENNDGSYITLHFVDPLVSSDTGYETCQKE
jgi:hypothetical protein